MPGSHVEMLFEHKASIPNGGLRAPDLLMPCPGCGRQASADSGHHLCWDCEGIGHLRRCKCEDEP